MIAFYRAYPAPDEVLPEPAAKVQQAAAQPADSLLWSIPWFHHVILLEKVKDLATRTWYIRETLTHGWSQNVLSLQIAGDAHARRGKAVTNFAATLPTPQSDLAQQSLKDPYIFDVRHDNREDIADAISRTLGRRCLSRPTYSASKDGGERSLLVKRRWATKCPDPRAARLAKYGEGYTA